MDFNLDLGKIVSTFFQKVLGQATPEEVRGKAKDQLIADYGHVIFSAGVSATGIEVAVDPAKLSEASLIATGQNVVLSELGELGVPLDQIQISGHEGFSAQSAGRKTDAELREAGLTLMDRDDMKGLVDLVSVKDGTLVLMVKDSSAAERGRAIYEQQFREIATKAGLPETDTLTVTWPGSTHTIAESQFVAQ